MLRKTIFTLLLCSPLFLDSRDIGILEIPVGAIRNLNAAQVSDSFNWLLLSSKTRGGLWNLESGARKFYVRGFKGGAVTNNGAGICDFPALDDAPHSLVLMNPHNDTVAPVAELPAKGAQQYGRFVLLRKSLKDKKDEKITVPGVFAEGDADAAGLRQDVRFELKDFIKDQIIWTRDFAKEAPEFSFDEFSGRLVFYWRLGGEASKAKLKEATADLQAKASALGNKADDYLVEVVGAFAQKTIGMMLIETGKGSFNVGAGLSEGNWLVLHDSEGRVLVYSIKDGALRHRFFGNQAAINPQKNQLVVENFPGEVALYDLDTGEHQTTFVINGSAAFVRFNLEGSRLLVLSDTQAVYAFDLSKLATAKTATRTK